MGGKKNTASQQIMNTAKNEMSQAIIFSESISLLAADESFCTTHLYTSMYQGHGSHDSLG